MSDWDDVSIDQAAKGLKNLGKKADMNVDLLRAAINNFIAEGLWREFHSMDKDWAFTIFADFCDKWMRLPLRKLEQLFQDEGDILLILENQAVKEVGGDNNPEGRNQHSKAKEANTDNISIDLRANEHGTGKAYTLRRLEKERPDLLEKVIAKEMSANKAAIAAGFRKVKTAPEQVRHWWAKCSPQEQHQLREETQ